MPEQLYSACDPDSRALTAIDELELLDRFISQDRTLARRPSAEAYPKHKPYT